MKTIVWASLLLMTQFLRFTDAADSANSGFTSFDTGYTICKIRAGRDRSGSFIVASSYDGALMRISYRGRIAWTHPLSGFMNRDIWCEDLDGDRITEILAANADGTLYCLDASGDLRWKFKAGDAPMNAVCVIRHSGVPFAVCGGYDMKMYYLTTEGGLVKSIASADYSQSKPWGKPGEKRFPESPGHIPNFIRSVRGLDGEEVLAVHGMINSNSTPGSLYLFKPMADSPFHTIAKLPGRKPYGDFSVVDTNADGIDEIVLGTTTTIQQSAILHVDLQGCETRMLELADFRREVGGNGYRVAQTVAFGPPGRQQFLTSFGSRFILSTPRFRADEMEFVTCGYSFNDLWKDSATGKILLASAQSGGSCVHILEPDDPQWKEALSNFRPLGKLKALLENAAAARKQLEDAEPFHQRAPKPVYMMTEKLYGEVEERALALEAEYGTPVFLEGKFMPRVEKWDRKTVGSQQYRERRDRRKQYVLTQNQVLEQILPLYDTGRKGVAFWGGHGNDPYMFSTDTMLKIADRSGGGMSVFIYPELEHFDDDFARVLKEHFYPMAKHFQGRNARIYLRNKHAFWHSVAYMPLWSRLISGEFADVFVPSMEETTDKTMEQSVAARIGIWAAGAVDQWGSRCARDNASFDRLRQHAHQMVPNHFLRTQIYHIAYGATYLNNYPVDQDYFSILYELIAKGVLFVPECDEIVSFNPVHLAMAEPDRLYLDEGNNVKWLTFYDEEFEKSHPMVFSRLNGTWPGAPVTEWDFSRYAAGVRDRRLNFLPPYENGMALITPPQKGVFADRDAPRGALKDRLHPLYRTITGEYITDGRYYYSSDGKETYPADSYYRTVEGAIERAAEKIPLTVSGGVAWVAAQTSPRHLRVTLIDSGYINPGTRTATMTFNTVTPVKVTDILAGETIGTTGGARHTARVRVPCGSFKFLDIELKEAL